MIKRLKLTLTTLALLAGSVGQTTANNHVLNLEDIAQIEVLPGWRTDAGTHMAAIQINLAPGWKTYWRAPGDAGIPPRFAWSGSRNLESVRFHWPTPKVFSQNGTRSIGYDTRVVIPMELTPSAGTAETIRLRGEMELGVCEEVCLPMNVDLRADLSPAKIVDPAISASLRDRPISAASAGVNKVTCAIDPISDGLRLTANITMPRRSSDEFAVVELADQTVWVSEAVTQRKSGQLTAMVEMVPPNAAPFALQRSDVRITVLGNGGAVDIRGCTAN